MSDLERCAVEHFGVTDDLYNGGYLLKDGKFLDMNRSKPAFQEHWDVVICTDGVHASDLTSRTSGDIAEPIDIETHILLDDAIQKFMDGTGAIRMSGWAGSWDGFEVSCKHRPTSSQARVLGKQIRYVGSANVEVGDRVAGESEHRNVRTWGEVLRMWDGLCKVGEAV